MKDKHKPKGFSDQKPADEPQVYAVSLEGGKTSFSRRDFLKASAVAAAAAALAGCSSQNTPTNPPPDGVTQAHTNLPTSGQTNTPNPTATLAPTNTPSTVPTKTAVPTNTPTATPLPIAVVTVRSANVRYQASTESRVVGGLIKGDVVSVLGRDEDGVWLRIILPNGAYGWIHASLVEYKFGSIFDLPYVTPFPTATPMPGYPGTTEPGETGIDYTYTDEWGSVHTYTLPCGSPIPPGAVCICNCVSVPAACSCDGACTCDTVCTCDSVCTCDGECSCDTVCTCDTVCNCDGESHYWYPN